MKRIVCRLPAVLSLALLLFGSSTHAATVACHITYGGETRTVQAVAVTTPYSVPVIQVGSYFLFRLVFQDQPKDHAAIKTYIYADADRGASPVPLHQAIFPYPPSQAGRYGFSGLHFVYEPLRDGELQYWCEMKS